MIDMIQWVGAHWADIALGATQIIGGASIIARLTPTLADDHALAWLQSMLEKVALNKKA